jgi:hypothetical protein
MGAGFFYIEDLFSLLEFMDEDLICASEQKAPTVEEAVPQKQEQTFKKKATSSENTFDLGLVAVFILPLVVIYYLLR